MGGQFSPALLETRVIKCSSDVFNHCFSGSAGDLCTQDTRRDSKIVQPFLDIRLKIGEGVGGTWVLSTRGDVFQGV